MAKLGTLNTIQFSSSVENSTMLLLILAFPVWPVKMPTQSRQIRVICVSHLQNILSPPHVYFALGCTL